VEAEAHDLPLEEEEEEEDSEEDSSEPFDDVHLAGDPFLSSVGDVCDRETVSFHTHD